MWEQKFKSQLDAGKRWVEQTLLRYAKKLEVSVEIKPPAWSDEQEQPDGGKNFDMRRVRFVPLVNGMPCRDERLVFTEENLTDIPSTESVRAELEEKIKEFIKSCATKPRKIGF